MGSIMLPVTLMTAGAAALINFWLAIRTSAARRGAQVSIGDGGDPRLISRMRAHANYVEYAPFVLILIALIEFTTGTSTWLWIVAGAFLLARLAHPFGMEGVRGARTVGIAVTLLIMVGLAIYAIMLPFAPDRAPRAPVEAVLPTG